MQSGKVQHLTSGIIGSQKLYFHSMWGYERMTESHEKQYPPITNGNNKHKAIQFTVFLEAT